jgi:nucleoid-associated protein YgaU
VLVPEKVKMEVRQTLPGRSIIVRKGDSLWVLARQHLGHGSAWTCLSLANPQITNFTRIPIGTKLQLPESDALEGCEQGSIQQTAGNGAPYQKEN